MINISNLYSKNKYLKLYGYDLLITLIIVFFILLIYIYFYIDNIKKPIVSDWNNKKCSPYVIPFAGYINNTSTKSNFEFTKDNFNECIDTEFKHISEETIKPYNYLIDVQSNTLNKLNNSMNETRNVLSNIRSYSTYITNIISDKIYLLILPLIKFIIYLKSFLRKSISISFIPIYTVQSIIFSMKSLFRQIIFPYVLVIIAIFLFGLSQLLIPFVGWVTGAITIAISIVAVGFLTPIVYFVSDILKISTPKVPKIP